MLLKQLFKDNDSESHTFANLVQNVRKMRKNRREENLKNDQTSELPPGHPRMACNCGPQASKQQRQQVDTLYKSKSTSFKCFVVQIHLHFEYIPTTKRLCCGPSIIACQFICTTTSSSTSSTLHSSDALRRVHVHLHDARP